MSAPSSTCRWSWTAPSSRRRCGAELSRIPYGETISYGELARRVGRPKGPRAVGQANGRNPIPIIVPCHRVLASNGIGGYGGGLPMKRALLAVEGVDCLRCARGNNRECAECLRSDGPRRPGHRSRQWHRPHDRRGAGRRPAPPWSCADINRERGARTRPAASRGRGQGGRAAALDVSERGAAAALVDDIVARHGALHVMCNIAGIMIDSSIIDLDPDEFDRILSVNLKGVLYGCQAAGKVMVEQGAGSIINMASAAVLAPSPGIGPYAICKAGVAQLTKSMAVEVGRRGVRVNTIAPGFIPTNMTARYYTNPDGTIDEETKEAMVTPMAKVAPLAPGGRDVGHRVLRAVSGFGRQQLRDRATAEPQRWRVDALLGLPGGG